MARYPTASTDALAFVAHGDLWLVGRSGGKARRLVRSEGVILVPRFSPDGRTIAFTQRLAGRQDVYLVAVAGGSPIRLTHDARPAPGDNLVVGWSPDGADVVFLSTRTAVATRQVQAYAVSVGGGLARRLPFDQIGRLDVSPVTGVYAFTRTFTDLATRKRYVGGEAEDIFTYDPRSRRLERITDWKGTDTAPMWAGTRLYFLSDRGAGFRLNLWCYDPATHAARQVTRFADGGIDWPSLGGGRIVFQQGGRLWALELAGERIHRLSIAVPDDGARTLPRRIAVGREVRVTDVTGAVNYAVAPDGRDALVAAHGDIFRVGAGGELDLTRTPAIEEDHPAFSPDGATVAYVAEDAHAQQVAIRAASGGPARLLTAFLDTVLYAPVFAPDGRRLAVADAEHRLWLVPLNGGAVQLVAHDPVAEIRDATFSPDGRWLAFSTLRPDRLAALHLYDLARQVDAIISGPLDGDRLPAFSADGRRLFFVSQRHETPVTGDRGDEASLATIASDGMYSAAMDDGAADMMSRAVALPVVLGRIVTLSVRGGALFYEQRPPAWVGGELAGAATLHRLALDGRDDTVLRNFDDQQVAGDGKHLMFRRAGRWQMGEVDGAGRELDVSRLSLLVDPRAEWRAMFDHAWRLDRDLFFNRTMNGSDWQAVHDAYARLLPLLGSREDFLYLLGEMQGELATSHSYVFASDTGAAASAGAPGSLGADLELDRTAGRYRFARVYTGDPSRERFRAPLNDPAAGTRVMTGEYLLAVDGVDLRAPTDPDALLLGKADDVRLTVAPSPDGRRRTVTVHLVRNDLELRRHDWVDANRARVDALSGGRIGYVFIPDFDSRGAADFMRQWQGQVGREALILDFRWNTGGYLSQAVLELLRRTPADAFVNRDGALEPLPRLVAPRAMATIVNAGSHSDGDQFPYFFRTSGLGPVIGQRTWGGVQGINGRWPLIDGTSLAIPKDSLSRDGHWIIENEGTTPDIPVDPEIDEPATGRDHVLETTVGVLMARIGPERAPSAQVPPGVPAYPAAGIVPGASFGVRP